jgi:hypothetical protein
MRNLPGRLKLCWIELIELRQPWGDYCNDFYFLK